MTTSPSSSMTAAYLTIVVIPSRWDPTPTTTTAATTTTTTTPSVTTYTKVVEMLMMRSSTTGDRKKEDISTSHTPLDVVDEPHPHHLVLQKAATRAAGMTHFKASVGPKSEMANLIVADLDSTNAKNITTLITSVADYVLVVDVGGVVVSTSIANKLANVVMPAAVAARATILGYLREINNNKEEEEEKQKSEETSSSASSRLLQSVAKQAQLPCLVDYDAIQPMDDDPASFETVFFETFTRMLAGVLPPKGCVGPTTLLPATDVIRFLEDWNEIRTQEESGDDSEINEKVDTIESNYNSVCGPFLSISQKQEAASNLHHPLMPVLKVAYPLRASLPFRSILITSFPTRQVAVLYVVQGTLKKGDSLISANLFYTIEGEEEKEIVNDEAPRDHGWSELRARCAVSSMQEYPATTASRQEEPAGKELAFPGEFITVQLQSGADSIQRIAIEKANNNKADNSSEEVKAEKGAATKGLDRGIVSFVVNTLPVWSVCGKLPPLPHTDIITTTQTDIDSLFPRPVALAQWGISSVYSSSSGDNYSTGDLLPVCNFDTATGKYTGGADALSRATLVGCGQACLHSEKKRNGGSGEEKEEGDDHHTLFLNCATYNRSIGMEVTYDTHVHLLEMFSQQERKMGNGGSRTIAVPERRAVVVFSISGANEKGEEGSKKKKKQQKKQQEMVVVSMVVNVVVLLRKLTPFMVAAASATKALLLEHNPPSTLVRSNNTNRARTTTPTVIDVVERVCKVTRITTMTAKSGDVVVKAELQPVSREGRSLLQVAAGLELAYDIPLSLLIGLGLLPPELLQLSLLEVGNAAIRSAIECPGDLDPSGVADHKEYGKPLGMWLLLAITYHQECEMVCKKVMSDTTAAATIPNYHRDATTKSRQALIAAAKWVASIGKIHASLALYMAGRFMPLSLDDHDYRYDRAALGIKFLLNLSDHTRRLWNACIGDMLPFEIVMRVVRNALVKEWGAYATREPILWMNMIRGALLRDVEDASQQQVDKGAAVMSAQPLDAICTVWEVIKELLGTGGSAGALAHLITIMHSLQSEILVIDTATRDKDEAATSVKGPNTKPFAYPKKSAFRRDKGSLILPIYNSGAGWVFTVENSSTASSNQTKSDLPVPTIAIHHVFKWYAALGGAQALGAPMFAPGTQTQDMRLMGQSDIKCAGILLTELHAPQRIPAELHALLANRTIEARTPPPSTTTFDTISIASIVRLYLLCQGCSRRRRQRQEGGGSSTTTTTINHNNSSTPLPINVITLVAAFMA